MAKEKEAKIVLERTYNIPLRRRWMHVQKYKRAKKAVNTVKVFLEKHMKPGKDEKGHLMLKLGKYLNEEIWKHGIKNPPHHIKVNVTKDDSGMVRAELVGAPKEVKEEPKKKKTVEKKTETKSAEKKLETKPAAKPKKE